MGRFLGPSDYDLYGVVVNLAWIAGLPLSAVGVAVVKYSASLKAKGESIKLKSLLFGFSKFSLLLNFVFLFVYSLFSGVISDSLGGGIVSLIIILSFSFPFSGVGGVLL